MKFCTHCGAVVDAENRFCTSCGARVEPLSGEAPAPLQASAAAAQSAVAAQPAIAAQPALAPAEVADTAPPEPVEVTTRSGPSLAMILAMAVLAVAIIGVGYLMLSGRSHRSAPAPIIDGTQGTPAPQSYGLEKYPGARPIAVYGNAGENVIAAFETIDTPEQVIGYYRVRFPVAQVTSTDDAWVLAADMGGRQVQIHAHALAHGSRVQISISR